MSELEAQLQLDFVPARVPAGRRALIACAVSSDAASAAAPRAGLPIEELAARVAGDVADSVRRGDVPTARRLEKLLALHIERGEVEIVDGGYRLTPLGRAGFGGLVEPTDLKGGGLTGRQPATKGGRVRIRTEGDSTPQS